MASFEEHCAQAERSFGQPYAELHLWLDEYCGKPGYGTRHRRARHHEAGIREAVRIFGPDVEMVARQHIITDLRQEGWTEQDAFPQDERHYVTLGFW
ncbi:hypothetical protein V6C53_02925 [Desulfocurvibacter africanus]|uniref:DUF6915 family protein n=1 Tax=Desulfocurvibacter africanus TaxID=873 RepID=UPI002FDA2B1D